MAYDQWKAFFKELAEAILWEVHYRCARLPMEDRESWLNSLGYDIATTCDMVYTDGWED